MHDIGTKPDDRLSASVDVAIGSVSPCWSCRGPVVNGDVFCGTCDAVQPPGQLDHFRRLGLKPGFNVDVAILNRLYFDCQRRLHPDRFASRTPRERALSQQQSTSVNEAYETLRDPLKRADYLVHLQGSGVLTEGCNLVADQELLTESLELRELLAEAETIAEVAALEKRAANDIKSCIDDLSRAFADVRLEQACRLTTRLKYLKKLEDECRVRRACLSDRVS
ncbi:MAG: Fe-S protein assembly co-chaperone HscB [Rhodospirillales bacterium]|nr:Fe-S protein assembly co-chaperone HscB [Rhodospirillales bacterium]